MLILTLPATQYVEEATLKLEHSLVSLSKWESIHEKPFFSKEPKSEAESLSYLEQMILNEDLPEKCLGRLTPEHYAAANEYISRKHTATWFREDPNARPSREIITNELIYSWMIALKIPFKPSDEWHLNRLMTLIRIRSVQTTKQKPMSRQARAEHDRRLNEQRRRELGTSG